MSYSKNPRVIRTKCFKNLLAEIFHFNTVNSLEGDYPWCTTKLREVVV